MPQLEEAARAERQGPDVRRMVVMNVSLDFLLHDLLDLPTSVRLRDLRMTWNSQSLDLLIESRDFPIVEQGQEIVQITPEYKRIQEHGMSGYYLEQLPLFTGLLDGPHAPQEPEIDRPLTPPTPFEVHVAFARDEQIMPDGTVRAVVDGMRRYAERGGPPFVPLRSNDVGNGT